jgi:hypothetical protein
MVTKMLAETEVKEVVENELDEQKVTLTKWRE